MERRTAEFKITLSTLARAQVEKKFIERTIAKALDECRGLIRDAEGKAGCVVTAPDEAGYAIVRKPDRPIDTATELRAFSDVMSEGMSVDREGVADPLPKVAPMDPRLPRCGISWMPNGSSPGPQRCWLTKRPTRS